MGLQLSKKLGHSGHANTAAGIKAFQKARGIKSKDPVKLEQMTSNALAHIWRAVKHHPGIVMLGMKSAKVRTLERLLHTRGLLQRGAVDGVYDGKTSRAVQALQKKLFGKTRKGNAVTTSQFAKLVAGAVKSPRALARLNNTRVGTQMPSSGFGYMGYYASSKRYGTVKTVETLKAVAARYHAATGETLRIGDISLRGGGAISGHATHRHGTNVDIDMAFNDGRKTAERQRGSVNATWRSPAYSRSKTRKLIYELRRANPGVRILFNDPVLVREGLVRPFPNHDNHLHLTLP